MTQQSPHQANLVEIWLRDFRDSSAFDSKAHADLPAPNVIATEVFHAGGFQKVDGEWMLPEWAMEDWLETWARSKD